MSLEELNIIPINSSNVKGVSSDLNILGSTIGFLKKIFFQMKFVNPGTRRFS
jgi:ssDNA-specific exonuclease RecJ